MVGVIQGNCVKESRLTWITGYHPLEGSSAGSKEELTGVFKGVFTE